MTEMDSACGNPAQCAADDPLASDVALELFTVFAGGIAHVFAEYPPEMHRVIEAAFHTDVIEDAVGILEKLPGAEDTEVLHVFRKRKPGDALKNICK